MDERFIVSIEKDADGTYIAYNQNGDGYALIGSGDTAAEAKEDFANSMSEVAESEKERKESFADILTNEPEFI